MIFAERYEISAIFAPSKTQIFRRTRAACGFDISFIASHVMAVKN
jgi:hypothetical protein